MTFTLNGNPTDVMVSAECFRGKDEAHVRGFEYGSITAPRLKDKLGMLEQLDVMVSKEDMPQPGPDADRRFVPESTLRPQGPRLPVGDLAGFLNAEEAEDGSQRSKGSSKGAPQPSQDSFRMSQPTQLSPKNPKPNLGALDLLSDDEAKPVKPFAGGNTMKNFFEPRQQGKGLGPGGQKRNQPVHPEEVSDSTSDSSATSDSDDTSDGGSESEATKKRKLKKKKEAKKKKAKKAKKAKKEKEGKKMKVSAPKKTRKAKAEEKKEEIKQGVATILLQLCYYVL
jgi:hypothetical protein